MRSGARIPQNPLMVGSRGLTGWSRDPLKGAFRLLLRPCLSLFLFVCLCHFVCICLCLCACPCPCFWICICVCVCVCACACGIIAHPLLKSHLKQMNHVSFLTLGPATTNSFDLIRRRSLSSPHSSPSWQVRPRQQDPISISGTSSHHTSGSGHPPEQV